jgi:hypothetical protein
VLIRYANTLEDLVAFHRYHWRYSNACRRQRAKATVALLSVALLGGWYAWYLTESAGLALAIWAYFAAYTAILRPWLVARGAERQVRRMYGEGSNVGILGGHELELTGGSLVERSDAGGSVTDLSAVEQVASTPEHTFIYTSAVSAHVIPRRAVCEGDYESFVAALRAEWAKVKENRNRSATS